MKTIVISFILFFLMPYIYAQDRVTISGYITDQESGEALIGATVYDGATKKGTTTNTYGFYSLTLNKGDYCLLAKYVGYTDSTVCLQPVGDTVVNFQLKNGLLLGDVVVHGRKNAGATSSLSGLNQQKIDIPMMGRMPVIGAEKDLLKSIQYLPGVKAGREGAAGFNVRGGGDDQNLILLDGVPVYNVSHVMGFFSVFNTDAINNADLYKGGIPARYGGRLSSVLDINMKEGNIYDAGGVFSISPVSARLSVESPIVNEKGACIFSYRRSYFDLPMKLVRIATGERPDDGYFFHDFNGKANWKFSEKSRLYVSAYFGKDKFYNQYKEGTHKSKGEYNWGNLTTSVRWNKEISNRLFANFSAYYSRFRHFQSSGSSEDSVKIIYTVTSKLNEWCAKADFDFYPSSNHLVKYGAKLSSMSFSPNIQYFNKSTALKPDSVSNPGLSYQFESYVENAFNLWKFDMNLGVRASAFRSNNKNFIYLQPRASVKYHVADFSALSATYTDMVQFVHLLTNSSLGLPTDLWAASTDKTGPQKARQVSLGYSTNRFKDFRVEVESYYKWMYDVISFAEGTAFLNTNNGNWEQSVIKGIGRAYGIEFMAEKKAGKITGLASYTLSWSERKFEKLNMGRWFPFKYDRRHDFSFLAEYNFKEKYLRRKSVSLGFTLQSGNNLSIPDTQINGAIPFGLDGENSYWNTLGTFDHPNNFKMPAFHHLDIGYNIIQKKTECKSYTWSFSVYNVYNHLNPWFYYREGDKIKKYSLFPLLPSVSFTYKW